MPGMVHEIAGLGRILAVWAHPDDETFMAGGLLAIATRQGQTVHCVTATRGEAGSVNQDAPSQTSLGMIRSQELEAALRIIGAVSHKWLDYPDGGCRLDDMAAVKRIAACIDDYKPDTVITFAPDGLTGHDDHRAVSGWVTAAVARSSHRPNVYFAVHTQTMYDVGFRHLDAQHVIYFNIQNPMLLQATSCDIVLSLPDDILDIKLSALRAMPSQYESFFTGDSVAHTRAAFTTEALVLASKWDVLSGQVDNQRSYS